MNARRLEMLLWISWRYHERRAAFLDMLTGFVQWGTTVFSSAALVAVLQHAGGAWWLKVALAGMAVAQGFVAAFKVNERGRVHSELRIEYAKLHARLEGGADLRAVLREKVELDAREPPHKHAIIALAYNDYARRVRDGGAERRVPWWAHAAGHFLPLDLDYKRKAPRQRLPSIPTPPPGAANAENGDAAA